MTALFIFYFLFLVFIFYYFVKIEWNYFVKKHFHL